MTLANWAAGDPSNDENEACLIYILDDRFFGGYQNKITEDPCGYSTVNVLCYLV